MNIRYKDLAISYEKEAISLLKKLLSYKSVLTKYDPNSECPFGSELKECLSFALDYAKQDGFKVYNADNYAGHIEFGEGEEILGILAHLDVVPAVGEWKTNPFEPTIIGNRLYARGTSDDKGAVAACYIAMKLLKDSGFIPKKRVRLILGCDEETGSRCLAHYFKKEKMPTMGFSPDAEYPLIYGEKAFNNFSLLGEVKSNLIISWVSGERVNIVPDVTSVVLSRNVEAEFNVFLKRFDYKGFVSGNTYTVYGKACHGSMPQKGINSNFIMADFINTIEENNFTRLISDLFSWSYDGKKLGINIKNGDMGELSINPGVFEIKDKMARIVVDCRVPTDSHFSYIDSCVKNAASRYGFAYTPSPKVRMHYVNPDSFLVKTLSNVYEYMTGDNVNKPMTIGGGTYAKFIDNCVAFGPMFPHEEDVMHAPNEYLVIDNFIKNIAIYAMAIYELVK